MTDCRRKTISSAATPTLLHTPTQRLLPKSTSHPSPDSLLHLAECPFGVPASCSSIMANSFLFGTGPKKKFSDSSFLFSPEKRAKRNPLHDSDKPNMTVFGSAGVSAGAKMLALEPQNSPSPSMRRSDVAILNLDQASLGSPVAKRPPRRQPQQHSTHPSSTAQTTTPRRPPSRSISGQPRPLHNLLHQQVQAQHFEFSTPAPPNSKVSRRISVENFLRPPTRDSPFGLPGPIIDASIHLPPQTVQPQQHQKRPKPHPLSFTESAFSTPSSVSSPRAQNPRVTNLVDSQQSFYTPQHYKNIRPLQAAFMSEGLLSKRNRSNSTGPLPSHMPDTPCKRPLSGTFGVFPQEPSTPLSNLRPLHFDSDSNSSQDTPGPNRSLSYLSSKSDYEFPPTPTKSVDNQGNTPSALWRVHNLTKSPVEDVTGFSPPKEHRRRSTTNGLLFTQPDLKGGRLGEIFEESQILGTGEFSEVYEVVERSSGKKYAVKRTRFPMSGPKERYPLDLEMHSNGRQRRLEEVRTLRALGHHEHILELIDTWEQYDHLFIQTELCENGSLDVFLRDYGNIERLDEFRVWKILLELTLVPSPASRSPSSRPLP